MADLESRGIPVVGIATTEFIQAMEAQAKALGTDPAYVFVPHPIQDRTNAELHALADEHLEAMLGLLVSGKAMAAE
jgi:alkanesulfonate monooxygenase SsuD/methylene tetrahydromethanopterin reductase-like flavin-dependent oxidoreductase (luciferase family)